MLILAQIFPVNRITLFESDVTIVIELSLSHTVPYNSSMNIIIILSSYYKPSIKMSKKIKLPFEHRHIEILTKCLGNIIEFSFSITKFHYNIISIIGWSLGRHKWVIRIRDLSENCGQIKFSWFIMKKYAIMLHRSFQ